MAYTIQEFRKYLKETREQRQAELYRTADEDVNGNPDYYDRIGREIEKHPIFMLRTVRGC